MPRYNYIINHSGTLDAERKHDERHPTADPSEIKTFYLKVCRVCLATGVKMYYIPGHRLGDMYKQVTGIEVNIEDNLPQVLCWECVARLSNASNFIEKALRTRWILTNSQINNGEPLTINSIITMNKTEYGLNSTLGYKYFNEDYADAHIIHEIVEADTDDTVPLSNNKIIDEAQFSGSKPYFDEKVDRETINGKEIFTSSDHAYVVTYKEKNANNDDGIKSEPLDINIDSENEQLTAEVNVKEECLSDGEMVVESNNKLSHESIKKESQLNDSGTLEDNNESFKPINDKVKYEDNILETSTNNAEIESTNNSNTNIAGNTSIEMHTKKLPIYTCDICNKIFVCKTSLTQHLENHPETFSCSFCAYTTYRKGHLSRHINSRHTRTNEFHCSFCTYTAYDKNTLQEHIHTQHINNTLYSCTFCAFKGYNKIILNKHIKTNHIKKPSFACTECDFKTLYQGHLLQHTNSKHAKRVSFTCSFCNFNTHDRNALSSHINAKHIKNTIYKCSYCNYETQQRYHLSRHVKAKHKETI